MTYRTAANRKDARLTFVYFDAVTAQISDAITHLNNTNAKVCNETTVQVPTFALSGFLKSINA